MTPDDIITVKLLTRAARAGALFDVDDDQVRIAGDIRDEMMASLRDQRDQIRALLTGPCAACAAPVWIHEADTHVPWCRPCANQRGTQLLRAEHPTTQEVA